MKTFSIGLNKDEKAVAVRLYEMMVNDTAIYFQLGYKIEEEKDKAIPIVERVLCIGK